MGNFLVRALQNPPSKRVCKTSIQRVCFKGVGIFFETWKLDKNFGGKMLTWVLLAPTIQELTMSKSIFAAPQFLQTMLHAV